MKKKFDWRRSKKIKFINTKIHSNLNLSEFHFLIGKKDKNSSE
jgi:hypothetical protein